jgi:hypothetical protein
MLKIPHCLASGLRAGGAENNPEGMKSAVPRTVKKKKKVSQKGRVPSPGGSSPKQSGD